MDLKRGRKYQGDLLVNTAKIVPVGNQSRLLSFQSYKVCYVFYVLMKVLK